MKFCKMGLGELLIFWSFSCLTEDHNEFKLRRVYCKFINVTSDVPHGSHLGPLIFSSFMNDVSTVIKHNEILVFADGLKLFRAIDDETDWALLQEDLTSFDNPCMYNGLELIPTDVKFLIL